MKRVLAVSDDTQFHQFLAVACPATGGFQVVPALNGWEAMAEQRLRPADLALLDFNASSWDAYQLLAELHQDFPALPVMGLTWTPEVLVERRMRNAGAVRMLNRNARPEQILNELVAMLEIPAKGHIEGIQLASLLQVLSWERKNCLVRVLSLGRQGLLYLDRGLIMHAQSDDHWGEPAAIAILGWEDAKVDFLPHQRVDRTIEKQTDEILMLAAQVRDEEQLEQEPEAAAPLAMQDLGSGPLPIQDPSPV